MKVVGLGPVSKGLKKGFYRADSTETICIYDKILHRIAYVEQNNNCLIWLSADINWDQDFSAFLSGGGNLVN